MAQQVLTFTETKSGNLDILQSPDLPNVWLVGTDPTELRTLLGELLVYYYDQQGNTATFVSQTEGITVILDVT